jgi:hypothetical protein
MHCRTWTPKYLHTSTDCLLIDLQHVSTHEGLPIVYLKLFNNAGSIRCLVKDQIASELSDSHAAPVQ